MNNLKKIHFKSRIEFRNWLEENHHKSSGIWMLYYKKHTNKETISYNEAIDEALCFGWIDSTIKRIDENRYIRQFTPRTNTKNWSDVNKLKVIELINQDRMTDAGLNKIDEFARTGKISWNATEIKSKKNQKIEAPEFMIDELSKNELALSFFNQLAPSYKREYIQWITSAKRQETIDKRLKEAIELLKQNKKLGMK